MPPRFLERMQMQSDTLKDLYGVPRFDPPPYTRVSCNSRPSTRSHIYASTNASETSLGNSSVQSRSSHPPSYQQATERNMSAEIPCIPRGSLILVTGANSWHGMHIIDRLLREGYDVRGTVRSASKVMHTTAFFHARYAADRFAAMVVPDMAIPGAFRSAVRGCSGLIHAAAVRTMSANPYDVIPQTIMGALNMLEAAAHEPRMRRVVHCGSAMAAKDERGHASSIVTKDSWNMSSFRSAWAGPPYTPDRAKDVLTSAAVQTELTVWKWYRDRKPGFVLNCVLPDTLWGELLLPTHAERSISARIVTSIKKPEVDVKVQVQPHHLTDIQDSALIHVAALILPGVMNERLFATAYPCDIDQVAQLIKGTAQDMHCIHQDVDQTLYKEAIRAEELLIRMQKRGWTALGTTVERACKQVGVN